MTDAETKPKLCINCKHATQERSSEIRYAASALWCGHPDHRSLVDGLPHIACGNMRSTVGLCGSGARLFAPATRLVGAPRMGATVPIRRYEPNRPDDVDNRPGGFDGPTGAD